MTQRVREPSEHTGTARDLPPVYFRYFDLIVERGEGCYVFDTDGRRWLDFTCGVGVTNTGHSHPAVVGAVVDQAKKMLHCQLNIGMHQPAMDVCARISDLFGPEYATFLGNTGSEAIEGALKLARVATGRPGFISFKGGFHGRTFGAMSLTASKVGWRAGYEPLLPSIYHTRYCDPLRSPECAEGRCDSSCLGALRRLFDTVIHPSQVAGIVVEPVLGEGGYVVPSETFLPGLRRICDEYGILLILDEVQTGYGRTGRMFGWEHTGTHPDIAVLSKGIASGLPLSAIVARSELMQAWAPGAHGGTYNGNIVACAAAIATLDVFEQERLVEKSTKQGKRLMQGLQDVCAGDPGVAEVRGLGMMIGVEYSSAGGGPDPDRVKDIREKCFDDGLLLLSAGTYGNVIRFIPPLVAEDEQIDQALEVFAKALSATSG